MDKARKCLLSILLAVVLVIEIIVIAVSVYFWVIPMSKALNDSYWVKDKLSVINHDDYFGFSNRLFLNEMMPNFDEVRVNDFLHTFINELNPYIMFSYLPRVSNGITMQRRIANENFFNLYDFEIYAGRKFESGDFLQHEVIPIVVGYNLRQMYKLGEVYKLYHWDEDKAF